MKSDSNARAMIQPNPTRTAWVVLWSAFAIFLLLCALVPYASYAYLIYATTPRPATLEVINGTVRVREPNSGAPIAVTRALALSEGSTIETDETSRGIITLLDNSTITLSPGTHITLREMRAPQFGWGTEPLRVVIDHARGRIRVGAAHALLPGESVARERTMRVYTAQMLATLSEGSYAIEVTSEGTQITTRDGSAIVQGQDRSVTVTRGQRTVVRTDEPPLPPLSAAQDIIINGDFKDPRSRGWNDWIEIPNTNSPAGTLANPIIDNRVVLRVQRNGANQTSAITGVIQQINREVSDYRSLRVTADVRLRFQSLSGGGILSSEYPIILRMKYRDVYGSEAEWVQGFYYQNLTNNPTNNGDQVPQDVWVPFESKNLFETLDPRPFFITTFQIYASGWDYDAYVTGVRLIVE